MSKKLPCGRMRPEKHSAGLDTTLILKTAHEKLKNWLKTKNLKYTRQRWEIAQLILLSADHLDAKQIVSTLRSSHPEIGPATVYRTLKVLVEADILKETQTDPKKASVYEIADGDDHHDHIICLDCGEIFEFHSEAIESAQNKITKNLQFSAREHHHVIQAHCDLLKRKKA